MKQECDHLTTQFRPASASLQHNNSARIATRNLDKEIQQQGILAGKLTGYYDMESEGHLSQEKVKVYQVHPKLKSPEHKQERKNGDKSSPQKENVSPYKLPESRRHDLISSESEDHLPSLNSPCQLSDMTSMFVLMNTSGRQYIAEEKEVPDKYPHSDNIVCNTQLQYCVPECWTSPSPAVQLTSRIKSKDQQSADCQGSGHPYREGVGTEEEDCGSASSSVYTIAESLGDVNDCEDDSKNLSADSTDHTKSTGGLLYQTVVEAFKDAGNDSFRSTHSADISKESTCGILDTTLNAQTEHESRQCLESNFSSNSGPKTNAQGSADIVSASPTSCSPDSISPTSLYVPSENSSEMFTCVEFDASDLNKDVSEFSSGSDVEEIPLDCPQQSFHDAWTGSSVEIRACRSMPLSSQMHNIEGYGMDLNQIIDAWGSNPRVSSSDPAIRHFELIEENTESKPFLNYAFCRGCSEDSRPQHVPTSNLGLVRSLDHIGISPSESKLCDHMILVEDTESRVSHTYLFSSDSLMSTSSEDMPEESGDFSTRSPCRPSRLSKIDNDNMNILRLQAPSTEALPITRNDLTKLLREIMQEARNLTQAERCSVFLIDEETEELVAKVFDGITTNDKEVQSEIRMPIIQGIAGHVATTGKLLNIKDAYSHPMFYRGIDDSTGFRTRNILCFPIKNEAGNVLGVAQLCNKKTGPFFTVFDEDVASAFAVYCCISISHCLMYKKLQDSQHRNRLANELMNYHMQVAQEEVDELAHNDIHPPSFWHKDFDKFSFPPRMIPEDDTEKACLTMFEDLGFISKFRIKRDTLARFVLMVRRGYRNPPYHNWMHAFAVTHFCYVCMKNLKLTQYLEEIEMFSLFTSCMCHDIDHRGTNNSYQSVSKSVLAALYSSEGSVLERHHFAQSMCIVNTDGCNLFENLSSKDYQTALDLMRDIILATDLAHHLRILKNIESMAKTGYDKENMKHHKLLLCLLMTASDLSDQTKPWDATKHIAALIYKEFFSQGDLEKSMGREPIEMMDRERARIPDLQIGFLDHIALPVYKVLAELFPEANCVRIAVDDNRRHWDKICALIKIRRGGSCEQMSYDQILALEAEDHSPQTNQSNHIQ
ncbi:uncharacterized protein [Argopecten irradians]|uniref:uncharacterized protein isoform X1 n=1 Tax=Argopecten irradians TaxID=31199 RepID=UPI003718E856